jgi:uncharacterized protein YfaA (DUF2138 family)
MNDYQRLFLSLGKEHAPTGLLERVQTHIHREETRRAKVRVILFSILLAAAFVTLIPTLQALRNAATESGFTSFLSLAMSDAATVWSAWPTFALSLLETLPSLGLILFLLVALITVEMLYLVIKNTRTLLIAHPLTTSP